MTSPGRLEHLTIRGFRSFENLEFELRPLNVLIGANGAGKSNFIEFFNLVHAILKKNLQFHVAQKLGADRLLYFGVKRTQGIHIRLRSSTNSYACRLAPTASGGVFFSEETCNSREVGREMESLSAEERERRTAVRLAATGSPESGLPDGPPHPSSIPGDVAASIDGWRAFHFHDTSATARLKQPGAIHDGLSLAPDAGNLAAFLRSIQLTNRDSYQRIVRTVQRVAPFFLDFVLTPDPRNPESIQLLWRHRGSEQVFGPSDISDGTLRFICLVTLFLQPNLPTMILIDEPELGLHPHAIRLLAGLMRAYSEKTQIIVSTQSAILANEFQPEDVVVVDRAGDASILKRLDGSELSSWLQDFGLGELWDKNVLGGTAW